MVMPGLINLDFNDVRTVMSEMGKAMMGTGEAEGEKRAIEAAEAAISNPLLDEVSMKGAKGVLINITGSMDMTLFEVDEAANRIRAEVDPEANIIVGSTFNQDLEGRVRVSVVATGIEAAARENPSPYQQKSVTMAVSRPWRDASATPTTATNPTPAPAKAPVAAELQAPQSVPVSSPVAASTAPAPAANPVGDVHERIRRMLTEGGESSPVSTKPMPEPAANPFRDAQHQAKAPIAAALDMFRQMGGAIGNSAPRHDEPVRPVSREEPASDRARPSHGDLFDDDDEGDLEIPSFLRKKQIS
jgi:cell division protein FtsZ